MTSTNESYQYSSVPVAGSPEERHIESLGRRNKALMGASVVLAAVLLTMGLASSSSGRQPASKTVTSDLPLMGASKETARSCTFDECFNNNCNAEVAPFVCLFHNGGPHMGCSPVAWTKETCDDDCDLSGCADLEIPDDTSTCEGVKCGKEWCAGGQVCHSPSPYQCQDGSARFGCSSDPLHWTLHTDANSCSKCCDASLC